MAGKSLLLALPAELRICIYELALTEHGAVAMPAKDPQLTHTCSQNRKETLTLHYRVNDFDIDMSGSEDYNLWLIEKVIWSAPRKQVHDTGIVTVRMQGYLRHLLQTLGLEVALSRTRDLAAKSAAILASKGFVKGQIMWAVRCPQRSLFYDQVMRFGRGTIQCRCSVNETTLGEL